MNRNATLYHCDKRYTSHWLKTVTPRRYERQLEARAVDVRAQLNAAVDQKNKSATSDLCAATRANERACQATAVYLRRYSHDVTQASERLFADVAKAPVDPVALGVVFGVVRNAAELAFLDARLSQRVSRARCVCITAVFEKAFLLEKDSDFFRTARARRQHSHAAGDSPTVEYASFCLSMARGWNPATHPTDLAIASVLASLHMPPRAERPRIEARLRQFFTASASHRDFKPATWSRQQT